MKLLRYIFIGLFITAGHISWAQDPELEGRLDEGTMDEAVITEEGTETLLLDNTRSKIGRDFYDAFFRHYADLPKASNLFIPAPADTTQKITSNVELDINAFIITIDELPALGIGTSVISISLNDQLIWQNYIQARLEIIEAYAFNAAEIANQYVINFKEVQQSLESEDQKGSGIF